MAERDGRWHHIAVTWTAADNGFTQIFMDGEISMLPPVVLHPRTRKNLGYQALTPKP